MNNEEKWKSIGDIAAKLMEQLEEDQRRVFERECKRDGVLAKEGKLEKLNVE